MPFRFLDFSLLQTLDSPRLPQRLCTVIVPQS
jgi:hypothetical protein